MMSVTCFLWRFHKKFPSLVRPRNQVGGGLPSRPMASLFPANEGYLERHTLRRRGWFSGKEIWESQYFVLRNGLLSWAQSQTQAEEEARR
eukprot:COSAG01_NODE_66745_length_269_cov_0.611765_1_plen_89_part_11